MASIFEENYFHEKLSIPASILNSRWKESVLETLQKEKENTVKTVAIRKIIRIEKIDTIVQRYDKIICSLSYVAESFSPIVGKLYKGKATLVIPSAIIVEIDGLVAVSVNLKELIPKYEFNSNRKVFTNGLHSFGVGDMMHFTLKNFRFINGKIHCIASAVSQKEEPEIEPIDGEDTFN